MDTSKLFNPFPNPVAFNPANYPNQTKANAAKAAGAAGVAAGMAKAGAIAGSAIKAPTTKGTTTPSTKTSTSKSTGMTAEQKYQADLAKQIQDAYNQQINFLSGQEKSLQAQLPDYLTSISKPFEAQQPLLEQQLAEQQAVGATQQEQLRQQEQQLFAQSRRTAEEAGLRALQQFGGIAGSSAGQAAGELIAREQLRQQGNIAQQRVQGIQNINDQLRAIQGEFNAQVANLNLQKEQALANARLEFQKQLDTIRKEKMQAGVTKAQMTIDALSNFAARRREIENQVSTQQNNLQLLREQATLNAQNLRIQQEIAGQNINVVPTDFNQFFAGTGSNQSNELAKVLQAGVAAGTIKPFGKNPSDNSDLFVDSKGNIVDIRGNTYTGGTAL